MAGRSFLVVMVTLAVVVLVACSSQAEQGSTGTTGNTPTATATKSPTLIPSPTPTQKSSGQLSDVCSAFSFVSGLFGDVSVTGSSSASSSLASSVETFFEGVLSNAFGGSANAGCFYEARADDGYALWVAFALSESAPSDATSRLATALASRGVNVAGSFTGQSGGNAFSWVMLEGLPLDEVEEAALYIVGNEVVVVTGSGEGEEEQAPTATSTGRTPTPTTSAQQPPTGDLVSEFDGVLRSRLQSALGVGLTLQSQMQSTSGEEAFVYLMYSLEESISGGTDVSRALEGVVKGLGGTVTSTLSTDEFTSLTFEGLKGDGHAATGSFLHDGGSELSVTLQVS